MLLDVKKKKKVIFADADLKEIAGRVETMTERHKDKWGKYINNMIEIDCVPLTPIIKPRFNHINFFSLDVEGAELDFLQSFDFEEIKVDIIIVEASDVKDKNLRIEDYMISRKYSPYHCIIPRSILFIHDSVQYCYGLSRNRTSLAKILVIAQDFAKCTDKR